MIIIGSLFSFALLLVVDTFAHVSNPYVGLLTYFVAPGFLVLGIMVALVGGWLRRRSIIKHGGPSAPVRIDLSRPKDRRLFGFFLVGSVVFLLVSAIGSYQTYHYTESVQFCGQACHGVMKPEFVTYSHSPHARVACAECHIGKGAAWYVRSKLSGTYQVYATVRRINFRSPYPRRSKTSARRRKLARNAIGQKNSSATSSGPIPTFSATKRTRRFTVRLLMKVGGGDPTHGPVGRHSLAHERRQQDRILGADDTRVKKFRGCA